MKTSEVFAFCLLLLVAASSVFAQTANFKTYDVNNGLSSSYIYSITHDKNGNLWFSSFNGVSRFNGISFASFYKRDGLADNKIQASCYDSKGNLWLGHYHGEITLYDGRLFHVVNTSPLKIEAPILSIYEDREGNIWFGTLGGGVLMFDGKNFFQFTSEHGLIGDAVSSILEDQKGNYWFATESGLMKTQKKLSTVKSDNVIEKVNLPTNFPRCLLQDKNGTIWLGTRDAGLFKIPENGKYSQFTTRNGLPDNFVYSILQDSRGGMWIGTYGGGAARIVEESGKPYFKKYDRNNGIGSNYVQAIWEDKEGNIWFGTYGGGVTQFKGEAFQLFSSKDGFPSGTVLSVFQDESKRIWFGTDEGLMQFTPPKQSSEKAIIKKYTLKNGLSSNRILSIYEDKSGTLWLGTSGGGVNRFDPKNPSAVEVISEEQGMSPNVISVNSDDNGNLWFATDGRGVYSYKPSDKSIKVYTKKDGLPSNSITTIFKDSKSRMWFSAEEGIAYFNGVGFTRFGKEQGLYNREQNKAVSATTIGEDNTGNLWIGTDGSGAFRFDGTKFEHFSTKDGLSSDNIFSILSDQNHNIWFGTASGIDRFNTITRQFVHFGKDDGFIASEMSKNAVIQDPNGNIWFGTAAGAVRYSPANDIYKPTQPIARLTSIKIFLRDTLLPERSVLSYDKNYLTFDYEAVSLRNPSSMKFQYWLEGYDQTWSPASDKRSVTYPDLPWGKYTFKVRANLNSGVWGEQFTAYEFEIAPPFWLSGWFIGLVGISLGGMIFFAVAARMQRVQQYSLTLEEEVTKRTLELADRNLLLQKEKEQVEQMNRELEQARIAAEAAHKAKSEFFTNITHELRTPMNSIIGFTRRILTKNEQDIPDQVRSALEIMYRNSQDLLKIINDLLDISKAEAGKIHYTIEEHDAALICREVVRQLHPLSEQKGIYLEYRTTLPFNVECDANRLHQVLLNIVSNAIKYTDYGGVFLDLTREKKGEKEFVKIQVRDTGIGISPENQRVIFDAFGQADPKVDQTKGGIGLGLAIAKRFVEDMGGDIRLMSALGEGSVFEIIIPAVVLQHHGSI